jgi:hypothetical protein
MATDVGLPLGGGMLPTIAPNATPAEQAAAINNIINKLNTWDGVIVKSDIAEFPVTADLQSLLTIEHGLNYKPVIDASINKLGIVLTGSDDLSMNLPTFISGAGINSGFISFYAYMFALTDDVNIYFYALNGTGNALGTFEITYDLRRRNADRN